MFDESGKYPEFEVWHVFKHSMKNLFVVIKRILVQQLIFIPVLILLSSSLLKAQTSSMASKTLREEKEKFIRHLKGVSVDTSINYPLTRFMQNETDRIYTFIANSSVPASDKEKATWSLVYFIQNLEKSLSQERFDIYDLPQAVQSYKNVLTALMHNSSFTEAMASVSARRTNLIAAAFNQYDQHSLLDDIGVYKRISNSPEYILQFLENKPNFRYADSLLMIVAANDPNKIRRYLLKGKKHVREMILSSKNIYIQQIVLLSGERNASELMPFVVQLAEGKLTIDSILQKRTKVLDYYRLLLETVQSSVAADDQPLLQKILRRGLKEKSLYFFANQINDLHNAADATRFASVKGLRPQELYYIITSCGEELYTSSYLGLYKRLMESFKKSPADSLFELVQYDNFRVFMRMAANYNVLADFLSKMPNDNAVILIRKFISGIEADPNTGLEKAMDIADSFTGHNQEIADAIQSELQSNLQRCKVSQQFFGVRLYSILLQVFNLVKERNTLNDLWATLGDYETLKRQALLNKDGKIVELVLFYGDDDGVASFNNFQKHYTDTSKWLLTRNESWITIESRTEKPILIYANLPLDEKEELDIRAQDALIAFMNGSSLDPTVLIHRGHSYHLAKTLNRLKPSVKLAILGSCGAYNSAISIATVNPDVQIIGSKKMGSKSINDPIIEEINQDLQSGNDLVWSDIWAKLKTRFGKDEFTQNLFNEYITPGKNVSLFVLKLYNYYNRTV